LKVALLAKSAVAAVIQEKTRLVPKSWEGTYFEWMNNIRDWCISRQIWWGHRIPVWYCDCGEVVVSTTTPITCTKCGGSVLRQEEDVLDTWFSSALWPFSTLGWPDKTKDLKTFYPTTLLITGFDILFFWVARMMMMGLYIMKDVPFRDVYLHALVRDEHGEKMSKSKGNVIDPLEMIDKFGADAFRFTLAAFTAQGRDIRMSKERIEGYRNFANKIWNATRFALMNLEDYNGEVPDEKDYAVCDRWIRHRLNEVISDVTRNLDEYRFNEAAGALYHFIWHELCDWYLELAKPVLYGKGNPLGRRAAQFTLDTVLKSTLKLLHPFMPFITEEIWQKLAKDGSSVMLSSFPIADKVSESSDAAMQMELLMEVISSIRNIRGEMNILPAKKVEVLVTAHDEPTLELLRSGMEYISTLGRVKSLFIENRIDEPRGAATAVAGPVKVFLFLEGAVDVDGEKARLDKEIAKLTKDFQGVSKKLANSNFIQKAAPAIIEKEQWKYQELQSKLDILSAALERLKQIK
jgi:valyl-tRNA synthetase